MRRPVEQLLGHRAGDRLADRAVHAAGRLVLERDPEPRVVVRVGVGAGRHHDRHHAFADRRPPVDGVGAERGQSVDREAADLPVPADAEPRRHPLVAGVHVGDEGFHAVGHVLDRPSQQLAHRRDRDLLPVDVQLDPEPAADIGRDDPDQVLGDAEHARQRVLLVPGRLVRAVHGEPALAGIVIGDDAAHLQRHAAMAGEGEAPLHDMRGPFQRRFGLARPDRRGEAEIAAELGMDQRGALVERAVPNRGRRQRLPRDRDLARRVLGLRAARGDDGGDGLALPDHALHRDRVLRRRDHPRQVIQRPLPGRADRGDLRPRDDPRARHGGARRRRVDAENARMRVGAAHECEMQEPGEAEIVGVLAAAEGEPAGGAPRQGAPDGALGVSHRSGSPSPSRPRPRWRDSRYSGSNCRTGTRGSRRGSSCAPPPASRPPSAACRACSSRIAARSG